MQQERAKNRQPARRESVQSARRAGGRSDKSRKRAGDDRKQRERQQTSLALALAVCHLLPVSPSMPRIAIFALLSSAGNAGDTKPVATATFCAPFTV